MPSSPRRVRQQSGQEKRTCLSRRCPGPMWASAPTKSNVRPHRRGRCPHRPAGYVNGAVRKNGHACRVSTPGPMWASAPTKSNVRPHRRGRCPHHPAGDVNKAIRKNGHACPVGTPGRCGHRPLQKATCVFSVGGDALIAPRGTSTERSGKRARLSRRHPGPMWASAPTKSNVRPHRMWRCPHRPAGDVNKAIRKNGHACPVGPPGRCGHRPLRTRMRGCSAERLVPPLIRQGFALPPSLFYGIAATGSYFN